MLSHRPTYGYTNGLQPFSVCRPLSTWWARRRPPVFASLFLTRGFGLICMSHVIRLDAKQSAKGCATCTWLEGATTCGVIQCFLNQIMPSVDLARPIFFRCPPPYQNPGAPTDFLSTTTTKIQLGPGPHNWPGPRGTMSIAPPPLDATAYGNGS